MKYSMTIWPGAQTAERKIVLAKKLLEVAVDTRKDLTGAVCAVQGGPRFVRRGSDAKTAMRNTWMKWPVFTGSTPRAR